jgi:hypothetical protein
VPKLDVRLGPSARDGEEDHCHKCNFLH